MHEALHRTKESYTVSAAMDGDLFGHGDDGDGALFDVLDRVLDQGLVVSGDLTLTVADVPLLYVALDLTLCSPDRVPEGLRDRAPCAANRHDSSNGQQTDAGNPA